MGGPITIFQIDGETVIVQLPSGRRKFSKNAVQARVPPNLRCNFILQDKY